MYNLWMSSSLEYLPLFIFVLTLTYKKKEKREKKTMKNRKHTQQQKEWMLEGGWSSSPSVTGVREGAGLTLAHSSPLMPRELFPFVCLHTAHWDQEFPAQNSVLLWTHHMHPLAPFKYYVIMLQKASSLDQKDTRRSSLILCDFHDDSTPIKGEKREKKKKNTQNPTSLFTED